MEKSEQSNLTLEAWNNLLFRYKNKYVLLDSFDRKYVILHNNEQDYVSKSVTKFKYSKYSLNKLVEKLRARTEEEIPREFIDSIVEFYKDKDSVDTIPLHLTEIRDVLFDMDLFIDFIERKQIDWEIIKVDDLEAILKRKKPKLTKRKNESVPLEKLSEPALKMESYKTEQAMLEVIAKADLLINQIQSKIDEKND